MIPAALRRAAARLLALLAPDRADRELERELAAHVALAEEDLVRRGLPPAEARAAAARVVRPDHIRELHRETRSFPWLEDLRRDVPYALRGLRRTPALAAAAVVTLALGIGAATTVFSIVHAVALEPLRYSPHGDRLVRLRAHLPADPVSGAPARSNFLLMTPADLDVVQQRTRLLSHVAILGASVMGLAGHDDAARIGAVRATASVFPLLDMPPLLGRALDTRDETTGADVVVIGYQMWHRYFAADPEIVGREIALDSVLGVRARRPYTVVGVMPEQFSTGLTRQIWLPMPAAGQGLLMARLAEGVTPAAALAELDPVVRELRGHGSDVRYELVLEHEELVRPVRPALRMLAMAAGLLLLIACVNVTNLLLARGLARDREMAMRRSLGATRGRLVRQALTESAIIALAGAAGGVAVAFAGVRLLHALVADDMRMDLVGQIAFPRIGEVSVDATALGVAVALGLATGLLVGVVPALRTSRVTHASGRTVTTGGRVQASLVAAQVALATALLVAGGLVLSGFGRLVGADTGYHAGGVVTFQVSLPADTYTDDRLLGFAETLAERLRGLPAVQAAAYANQLPLVALRDTAGGLWRTADPERRGAPGGADARYVSHDYLRVMGVRVVEGRGLDAGDGAGQPRVLLVNRALAEREFPGESAIGQQVYVGRDTEPWTVVGVVDDLRQFALERPAEPQFFIDLRQWTGGMPLFPGGAYFAIRSDASVDVLLPDIGAAVRTVEPAASVFHAASMAQLVDQAISVPRLYVVALALFAVLGLTLAVVGLYSVLAYGVVQRHREIGIRMALGARRRQVVALVVGDGWRMTAVGLAAGLVGAAAFAQTLESLLYGVPPLDVATYGTVALVLAVVATLAALLPARRATTIDPAITLRCE